MKHLLLAILAMLCMCRQVSAQTPFIIQDTTKSGKPIPIDTIKVLPEFPSSQVGINLGSFLQAVIPPSPTSQAYNKFINYDVSIETGVPQIDIPLFEFKAGDISIPVSLKYHASGIKFRQHDGEVGAGWVLEPGYRISRTIYGRPDELTEKPEISDLNNFPSNQQRDYYLSRFIRKDEQDIPYGGSEYDGEYDMFTFSIPTVSGSFVIEDRQAKKIKQISRTNTSFEYTTGSAYSIDKFTIRDGNGMTYVTGPVENNLNSGYIPIPASSWVVQDIKDRFDNNVARFNYVNVQEYNNYSPSSMVASSYLRNEICIVPASATVQSNPPASYNVQRLSEILTDELTINFHRNNALDSIIIKNKQGDRIRKITLHRSTNIHSFLDSVRIFGKDNINPQVYRMDYLNRETQQDIGTFIPDYWNFYKSVTGALSHHFPEFEFYALTNLNEDYQPVPPTDLSHYGLTRSNRNANEVTAGNQAASFTLNRIIYPTGGSTSYEYESHKYTGHRDDTNLAGVKFAGIRVSRITSNDALGNITLIKDYKYGNSENGMAHIGAIDLANSIYFAQDIPTLGCFNVSGGADLLHAISYSTMPSAELAEAYQNSCPVYYDKVTEYTRESVTSGGYNNGKIEYEFSKPTNTGWSGYSTNQGYVASNGITPTTAGIGGVSTVPYTVYYPNYHIYEHNSWDKQVLKTKKVYKSNGSSFSLISKERNLYAEGNLSLLAGLKIRRSFTGSMEYGSARNYYASGINSLFDYAPYTVTFANKIRTESDIISYNGNDSLQVKEKYYYNSDYQLAKTETWNSDGSMYTKTTKYPVDYGNITATDNASLGLKKLQTSHVLNTSIEDVTEHGTTTKRLVDAVLKTFKTDKPLVDKVLSAESDVPVTNFTHSFNNSGAFNSDTRYQERARFNSYDSKGNLLEQQKSLGAKEVFLWGYDSNYPVAKVVGSDLATVQGFVNQSVLNSQATTDLAMRTELNKIRLGLVSSSAQVSTYTYQPLVGVSSETDPIGKTLLYDYDRHGRLAAIKNSSGATRVSYCYNLAGQLEPCAAIAPTGSIAASNLILIASAGPALPVTLIGFKATKIEKTTLLNWTTTNEVNSDRFEIERSSNAKHWNRIGAVSAAGDEKGNKQYSFTDMYSGTVPAGEYLYRLKMVDTDGQHAYSSIQSVSFDKNGDLILYPNPVTIGEKLTLQTDNYEKIREIRILDSYGKVVLKSSSTRLLDTSKLSPGLYLVQVTFLDNSVSTQRIVKQ